MAPRMLRTAALGILLAAVAVMPGAQHSAVAQPAGLTFGPSDGEPTRSVLVVSRRQVLEDSNAARAIADAERRLAARLQADIDSKKGALAAEEEELARLRASLPREDFEARADAFRNRVQVERRLAQQRSAALQTVFRNARRRLVEALGPILAALRAERGADVIVNADAVLVADPRADVTADVLAAFNARVPPPQIQLPEILRSALEDGDAEAPAPADEPESESAIPALPLRLSPGAAGPLGGLGPGTFGAAVDGPTDPEGTPDPTRTERTDDPAASGDEPGAPAADSP